MPQTQSFSGLFPLNVLSSGGGNSPCTPRLTTTVSIGSILGNGVSGHYVKIKSIKALAPGKDIIHFFVVLNVSAMLGNCRLVPLTCI